MGGLTFTTTSAMMDEVDVIISSESLYLNQSVLLFSVSVSFFFFQSELIESQEKFKPSPNYIKVRAIVWQKQGSFH